MEEKNVAQPRLSQDSRREIVCDELRSVGYHGYSADRGVDPAGGAPGVPSYMSPRHRGRGIGQFQEESEGQNEEVQRSVPRRGRDRQVVIEVDELAARVDDMKLVMARFQRMNPQTFNGDEPSSDAESYSSRVSNSVSSSEVLCPDVIVDPERRRLSKSGSVVT
ncbi:cyclic nucleotide-gated ion channel 1 [Dorcoceras hygrometricum]|uniref:Cyclic nucleotide-gated ion channel 1 n=1 Tax=Dorcoceras hygrometricum TaxID=472368 RepID=A0A2Z7DEJ9_9LAMI|nr:cyclic nucleotide-gated ion channel 1 [Dorcoceras hygrometricum]